MNDAVAAPLSRRVGMTLVAPHALFAGFRQHAPWLGPLLISTVVAVLSVFTVPGSEFVAQTEGAVNRRGRPVTVTSEPEQIIRYGRYLLMMSRATFQPLTAFGLAGLLALIFSVFLRGEARYRQYLAVTTHALLIPALGTLVTLPLLYRGPTTDDRAGWPQPFLAPSTADLIGSAVLPLFSIWALVVAAAGVSAVNRGQSWAKASGILVGLYLLLAGALAVLTG